MTTLPGCFFLDDPSDGVSSKVLADLGVRLVGADAHAAEAPPVPSPLELEHSFSAAVTYAVTGGGAIIDVRDSAGAWVRLVLPEGASLQARAGVFARVAPTGSPVYPPLSKNEWPDAVASREQRARLVTTHVPRLVQAPTSWGTVTAHSTSGSADCVITTRFVPGSEAERAANIPHFMQPGEQHIRDLVVDLCASFYSLGWVTGTGGSISIRHGARTFMAPSGVQKERMQPQDIYVLDADGDAIYAPQPLPGKPRLKLSQCAPLFHHAFTLRGAGACIHTHDLNAVLCTLQNETEFRITHQEMIKGIAGHGFLDELVVPIIENTPHECDLAESLGEAMQRFVCSASRVCTSMSADNALNSTLRYPKSNAVLVRRHGVYVWGASWEAAKTQVGDGDFWFFSAVVACMLSMCSPRGDLAGGVLPLPV